MVRTSRAHIKLALIACLNFVTFTAMKALAYLNKYFYRYKWHLLPGLVFVIISNLFGVVPAQVVGHAFNLITQNIALYRLYDGFERQAMVYDILSSCLLFFGLLIIFLYVMRGIFLFFMRQTIILMSRHIEFDLKNEIYSHYQKLTLGFYRSNATGDLLNRATEDVSRVRMYVGPAIMYALNTTLLFCLVIYFMFDVNSELAIYSLLPLPFLVVAIYYVNTAVNHKSEKIQEQLSRLSSFVQERFAGIRVIKAYVRERHNQAIFAAESQQYKDNAMALVNVQALFFPTMLLLVGISTILTVFIGGRQVIDGYITPGNIAEFIVYLNQLTFPVTMLGWVTALIQRAAASQKRINQFLTLQPEVKPGVLMPVLNGSITFNQVNFTYPDTGIRALKEVSFEIKEGEFVAIIGRTGAGKSTLANLLMRMYDVDSGEILIDGHKITDLNLQHFRSQIGFVPQEVFLFSDTIKNNIAFGLNEINESAIVQAAKNAVVYQNIMGFGQQFETLLGERGITLSGGQKQRVSIARALIKHPKLLIFDDSLSAVDTKTEEEILTNLGKVMANKTTLVIAHRISTIKNADKILVMDDGRIIERGTHQQLLQIKGVYAEIYKHQLLEESI